MFLKEFICLSVELLIKHEGKFKISPAALIQPVQEQIFCFVDIPVIGHGGQLSIAFHHLQRYRFLIIPVNILAKHQPDQHPDHLMHDPHIIIFFFKHG